MEKTDWSQIQPGTKLTTGQSEELTQVLQGIVDQVHTRRRGILLTHNRIESMIGEALAGFDWAVEVKALR